VQALLDMPADSLSYQPTPDLMTYRDLALHILNAGSALAGLLIDGVDDWTVPGFRDGMKKYYADIPDTAHAEDIAELLTQSIEQDCGRLAGKPAEFWEGMMRRFDGQEVTRLEMLQFCKEHELTHRSQMFMYLRLRGLVPPTTRRRLVKR